MELSLGRMIGMCWHISIVRKAQIHGVSILSCLGLYTKCLATTIVIVIVILVSRRRQVYKWSITRNKQLKHDIKCSPACFLIHRRWDGEDQDDESTFSTLVCAVI